MAHDRSSHENGAVETQNNHLKVALDQALMLRGSRDFAELADWRRFVDELVARRNRRRDAAVRIEMAALRSLPRCGDRISIAGLLPAGRITDDGGIGAGGFDGESQTAGAPCGGFRPRQGNAPRNG